ncbi:DUF4142 domain-containing protein [Gaopeijia maritima]|uniref:DUF4142 domain-containing protein n=1 Tax=Gaopeijia maritima TaxID=3119007 RepID=UPI0032558ABD
MTFQPLRVLALISLALPTASTAARAQTLDDAAIAHIAVTANQLDVVGAEQALERSTDPGVRAFAETMIRDHRGVIEQAAALAEKLGVTPADNDTSRGLTTAAEEIRRDLDELRGAAFDRAYIDNEVAYHETVIGAVEETLIPHTSNAELRSLLEAVVPALKAHLEHARRLRSELARP